MMPTWRKNYLRYKSFFLNTFRAYRQRPDLKMYLEIILSSITISIFAIFALRPTLLTISRLIKEVDAKQKTLAVLEQKIQDTSDAENLYRTHENNIKLLDSAIPKDPNVATFFRQISGASKKNSVEITNFSLESLTLKGESQTVSTGSSSSSINSSNLSFSISTKGLYKTVLGFIKDFENTRRPILFSSFSLGTYIDKNLGKLIILSVEGESPYTKSK